MDTEPGMVPFSERSRRMLARSLSSMLLAPDIQQLALLQSRAKGVLDTIADSMGFDTGYAFDLSEWTIGPSQEKPA